MRALSPEEFAELDYDTSGAPVDTTSTSVARRLVRDGLMAFAELTDLERAAGYGAAVRRTEAGDRAVRVHRAYLLSMGGVL